MYTRPSHVPQFSAHRLGGRLLLPLLSAAVPAAIQTVWLAWQVGWSRSTFTSVSQLTPPAGRDGSEGAATPPLPLVHGSCGPEKLAVAAGRRQVPNDGASAVSERRGRAGGRRRRGLGHPAQVGGPISHLLRLTAHVCHLSGWQQLPSGRAHKQQLRGRPAPKQAICARSARRPRPGH